MTFILQNFVYMPVHFQFILFIKLSFCGEYGLRPVFPTFVKLGEAPYVVLVDAVQTKCTGTLISDLWVLTTAFCVQDVDYKLRENISVVAGILDYESKEHYTSRQERSVVKTIVFPRYKDPTYVSALTLLKVNASFKLNTTVQAVKLQSRSWHKDDDTYWKCLFYGFGDHDYAHYDSQLKVTNILVKNAERSCPCTKRYQWKYVLCLSNKEDISLCLSHFGGPIICQDELIGVALRLHTKSTCLIHLKPNDQCGKLTTMSLFMYVCPYLHWIQKETNDTLDPSTFPVTCIASYLRNDYLIIVLPFYIFLLLR